VGESQDNNNDATAAIPDENANVGAITSFVVSLVVVVVVVFASSPIIARGNIISNLPMVSSNNLRVGLHDLAYTLPPDP
jgi:hypothetical protein